MVIKAMEPVQADIHNMEARIICGIIKGLVNDFKGNQDIATTRKANFESVGQFLAGARKTARRKKDDD